VISHFLKKIFSPIKYNESSLGLLLSCSLFGYNLLALALALAALTSGSSHQASMG